MTDTETDDPNKIYRTQVMPGSWQQQIISSIIKGGLPVILLSIGCYVFYTGMKSEIPAHLKTITDGYKVISEQDRDARSEDVKRHLEAVRAVVDGAKDSQDRLERILTNKINLVERKASRAEEKVEENSKKLEGMGIN